MQVFNITMWRQHKDFSVTAAAQSKVWHPFEELFLATAAIFIFELFSVEYFFILSLPALNFRNIFKSIKVFPFPVFSPLLLTFTGQCLRKSSWKCFSLELQGVFRETSARNTDLQNLLGSSHWCGAHLCNAARWDSSALEMKYEIQFCFHKHRCKEAADTEMMLKC